MADLKQVKLGSIYDLDEAVSEELAVLCSLLKSEEFLILPTYPPCLELKIKPEQTSHEEECDIELKVFFPMGYPTEKSLRVQFKLFWKWAHLEDHAALSALVRKTLETNAGCPQLYDLFLQMQEFRQTLIKKRKSRWGMQTMVKGVMPAAKKFGYSQKNMSTNDLVQTLRRKIRKTMDRLKINPEEATQYLRKNLWVVPPAPRLLEPMAMTKAPSMVDPDELEVLLPAEPDFTCNVCFEREPVATGCVLECGHWACVDCLTGYLESQIRSGALVQRCVGCAKPVPETLVASLVSAETFARANKTLIKNYTNQYPKYALCPTPTCETVMKFSKKSSEGFPFAGCQTCDETFCTSCGEISHYPILCDELKSIVASLEGVNSLSDLPDSLLPTEENVNKVYDCIQIGFRTEFLSLLNDQCLKDPNLLCGPGIMLKFRLNVVRKFLELFPKYYFVETFFEAMEEVFDACKDYVDFVKTFDTFLIYECDEIVVKLLKVYDEKEQVHVKKEVLKEQIEKMRSEHKFSPKDYILKVDTKPCPKCNTHWEKNGGCKHMHCQVCGFHFCWECLQPFTHSTHPSFYQCNMKQVELVHNSLVSTKDSNLSFQFKDDGTLCGKNLSKQHVTNCINKMTKLRNFMEDTARKEEFAKRAGKGCRPDDIDRLICTLRVAYLVLQNGYMKNLVSPRLFRNRPTYGTMMRLESTLNTFRMFTRGSGEVKFFMNIHIMISGHATLVQLIKDVLQGYEELWEGRLMVDEILSDFNSKKGFKDESIDKYFDSDSE